MAFGSRNKIQFGADPRADLLPDAQRAELRHERTMPKILLLIVASAAVAGLIWVAGSIPVQQAEQRLSSLDAELNSLRQQVAGYSEVQQIQVGGRTLSGAREQLAAPEVLFMDFRKQVIGELPSGSVLSGFNGYLTGVLDAPESTDPLCETGAANVQLTVVSAGLVPAAALIERISKVEGVKCTVVTESRAENSTSGEGEDVQQIMQTTTIIYLTVDETHRSNRFAPGADAE